MNRIANDMATPSSLRALSSVNGVYSRLTSRINMPMVHMTYVTHPDAAIIMTAVPARTVSVLSPP